MPTAPTARGVGTGLDRELRRLLTARRVRAAQQCRVARHASAPDRGHTSERRSSGIRLRRKGLRVIKARLSGTRLLRSDPPHRRNTIPHPARAVRAVLVAAADRIRFAAGQTRWSILTRWTHRRPGGGWTPLSA